MMQIPTLIGDNPDKKRQEIKEYFNFIYSRYESLFSLIKDSNSFYKKPDLLRHPLIFYYGHTATFFINKLILAKVIDERIEPKLESIFAVGVDEMSWDDLNEGHYKWASLSETQAYRDTLCKVINNLIDTLPLSLPIEQSSPWWIILMGIEHENIHIETSSVLIRQLSLDLLKDSSDWKPYRQWGDAPTNRLIDVSGGEISLGKDIDSKLYGWDNEYGEHTNSIISFKASKYLVSNSEFLDFVEYGGYRHKKYWEIEGWEWREHSDATQPTFWIDTPNGYKFRTLSSIIDFPLNAPVEVNYHEAKAFCNWLSEQKGINIDLPTEDEYMYLIQNNNITNNSDANINLNYYASSTPVDMFVHGDFCDLRGNVWQWSRTPIYPFNGFEVHPIYDDFTVPTYDGKHNLIKGGSWASCGNVATTQSRYAFRKHFFQHAGFRYVQSDNKESLTDNSYEDNMIISQYCHFGWGESYFDVDNYPKKCASIAIEIMSNRAKTKALDLGCAIGRSSFELAKVFDKVIGIDFSTRFIQNAQRLKELGVLRYSIPTEGKLENFYEINLKEFALDKVANKVEFWQGDACNLKSIYQEFDLIFAGNLLDRLYDPKKFLESLASRLNRGGILILTSPYTWQEESTPKEKWIGGFKRDGENFNTLDGIKEILEPNFRLLESRDIPFVIRETNRKFQHTIAQMSIWELLS